MKQSSQGMAYACSDRGCGSACPGRLAGAQAEMGQPPGPSLAQRGDTHVVPKPSTSNAPTSTMRLQVLGLAALFIGAAAGATYFWVGVLSGPEPPDADYLWRPWPFLNEHETAVGVVSTFMFVVTGRALVVGRRPRRMSALLFAQVLTVALFAAWLGLAYGVITDGVTGANIGGGFVMLVTPVFALATVAMVVGLALQAFGRREGSLG